MPVIAVAAQRRGGGRHAHYRNRVFRPRDPVHRMHVIVAVQHELGAVFRDQAAERPGVDEALEAVGALHGRRVMDQHDAEQAFVRKMRERVGKSHQLIGAELAGGEERRGRQRGGKPDQRRGPAPAHIGKRTRPAVRRAGADAVAAHVIAPVRGGMLDRVAHIGVVIARHHAHVVRRAEPREPFPSRREFLLQRDVDEVAGDRDVVRRRGAQVMHQGFQHFGAVPDEAPPVPIDEAERALAGQLAKTRHRHGPEVRIRQMRQHEHGS